MIETAISFWTEIQRYEDMLEADPRSYCFAPLSELYRKLGLLDDAVSVAQKGCALHPDYPEGFLALAKAYQEKGLKDQARGALEKVVQLTPENLEAQKLLGTICAELGETDRAQQALHHVVGEDPADSESGFLLHAHAEPDVVCAEDEVLEDLEIVEELTEEWGVLEPEPEEKPHSRSPLSTATMAELYATQGFPEKALLIYRELLTEDPGNATYLARVAQLQKGSDAASAPAVAPAPPAEKAASAALKAPAPAASHGTPPETEGEVVQLLEGWLENIRRNRHAL